MAEQLANLEKSIDQPIVEKTNKYIKFADGTVIAWGNFNFSITGYGSMSPLYYFSAGSNIINVDIGIALASTSTRIVNVRQQNTNPCVMAAISIGANSNKISAIWGVTVNSTNASYTADYIIIGKAS